MEKTSDSEVKRELEAKLKLEDLIDKVRMEMYCLMLSCFIPVFLFLFLCVLICVLNARMRPMHKGLKIYWKELKLWMLSIDLMIYWIK